MPHHGCRCPAKFFRQSDSHSTTFFQLFFFDIRFRRTVFLRISVSITLLWRHPYVCKHFIIRYSNVKHGERRTQKKKKQRPSFILTQLLRFSLAADKTLWLTQRNSRNKTMIRIIRLHRNSFNALPRGQTKNCGFCFD